MVSLLVAVYNAADTLTRCLDSLLAQTFADLQIICIDDASTDDSPAILARYADSDPRITVVRLAENGGQAHARNVGLALADGDFIGMVDADDWLAPDAIGQAMQVVADYPETDAVLFDLVRVWPDGREERFFSSVNNSVISDASTHYSLLTNHWSGLDAMRLSLTWKIHGLYLGRAAIHKNWPYDETARLYSDDNTTRLHYLHSREVRTSGGRYYYYQNPSSTTQRISPLYFESLRAQEHMSQLLADESVAPDIIADYEQYRWMGVIDCCYYLALHRRAFTRPERRAAVAAIADAWASFPSDFHAPRKFGYRRCRTFRLFLLQERLYFAIRLLLRRK